MTFDLQGQLLQAREARASQFWNTHNIYTDVDGGVFDALMRDNALSPIGRTLRIWNRFLGDEMLAATSSDDVRCFARQAQLTRPPIACTSSVLCLAVSWPDACGKQAVHPRGDLIAIPTPC
jgi:hypothetical protein